MRLSFHTFDPAARFLQPAPGTVEAYPGGDVAVRGMEPTPTGTLPVAWNVGGTLNHAALAQWVAFHYNTGARAVLVMPYLPSARGDHDPTWDAQTAARLTAATGVLDVIAADPHSPVWEREAALWGTTVHAIDAAELIAASKLADQPWGGVIAPDKGARERAGQVARHFGVPLLTAGKVRDPATGKLGGFTAPSGIESGRFLVVDDICDGGGTFAGLADSIRAAAPGAELHLWVTHGLFTGRWRTNLLPNYASVTAVDTTPDFADLLPSEVFTTRFEPRVMDALSRIHVSV